MAGWLEMMSDELEGAEGDELIRAAAEGLDRALKEGADVAAQVGRTIGRRLAQDLDADTFTRLDDALVASLGRDSAYLVEWVMTQSTATRLERLERISPQSKSAPFIRSLVSAYAPEIARAFLAWNMLPDDWHTFNREVLYDSINARYRVRCAIDTYCRGQVILDTPPNSLLELLRVMSATVRMLPADTFTPSLVEAYIAEADGLKEHLTATPDVVSAPTSAAEHQDVVST